MTNFCFMSSILYLSSRSATNHVLCIWQILEIKWEYYEAVHQLFIYFKKAYDSVRREVLYNILNEFCMPMKLVRLIIMYLNETYSRVWVVKYLCVMFSINSYPANVENMVSS